MDSEPRFTLEARWRDGTLCLSMEGALDWPVVGELWSALDRYWPGHAEHLVLDLAEIAFLDDSGLRALLEADRRGRACNCDVTIVRPRGSAQRVFTLTRAGQSLAMVDAPTRRGPALSG